jgi:S1-C subfamily serine protease
MKRLPALSFFFIIFCVISPCAQVRESVVIVQPSLSNEAIAAYKSIARYFRERNLGDLASYFDSLTKGGYGSGFLATDPYERLIVVTNRHVVAFSDSAKIIASNEEGEEKSIENCPIIYEDPDIDCAFLLLPEDACDGAPRLRLAESIPSDGETVWSAGYPGLFGKPSWQLAKGVVTNRRVIVESMGMPEYAIFMQHSAPIDPGNSGGPLLVGDPSDTSSLQVVGINTWMVMGRQSANFAISLDRLRFAFQRVPNPDSQLGPEEAVRSEAGNLITSLNMDKWSRFESSRYISSRMVMRQGWNAFISLGTSAKEADRKIWVERFLGESPEETLREAVFFKIYSALHKKEQAVTIDAVHEIQDPDGTTRVRTALLSGSKTYFFDWYKESGNWRILEAGIPSAGLVGPRYADAATLSKKHPAKIYQFPSGFLVGAGVQTSFNMPAAYYAEVGYYLGILRFASIGGSLIFDRCRNEEGYRDTIRDRVSLAAEARIGFPIALGKVAFFPYVGATFFAGITTNGILHFPSGGADLGLMLKPSSKLSFAMSYGVSTGVENLWHHPYRLLFFYNPNAPMQ